MGYELSPRNGGLPAASEVARLLRTEFRYVRVDAAEGLRAALAHAAWIERMPAKTFLGRHEEALEHAAALKKLSPGEALAISFGDSAEDAATITVIPGEAIQFGYRSTKHEREGRPLVDRCARALDCDVAIF